MMEYLYHRVPKNMNGTMLYPLNVLKNLQPEIYAEHVKKYEGREELLTTEIPPLNCLWNDVLHMTAVSPPELKANLAKAGLDLGPMPCFKIPVDMIAGENSIAFIYRRDQNIIPTFDINEQKTIFDPGVIRGYEKFNSERMSIYRTVPYETIEYYKRMAAENRRPLLFHLVPHVLFKGMIETKELEIVQ